MASYDEWKTRVPEAHGSGRLPELATVFWRAFDFAVRNHCVEEFLAIYRTLPPFAALVAEAERRLQQGT